MIKTQKYSLIVFLAFLSMFFVFVVKGADTSEAEVLLYQAEEAIDREGIGPERLYEINSFNAFLTIVNNMGGTVNIKETIENPETTQIEIDEIVSLLELALSYLTFQTTYDEIILLYNQAIAIDFSGYTPNSINAYMSELNSIHEIITEPTSGEVIIQSLTLDIQEAINLLIVQANKTNLINANNQAIIAYYEEKVLYTLNSYELFKTEVDNYGNYLYVNSVIADNNISQAYVDELTSQILDILVLLELKIDNSQLLDIYNDVSDIDLSPYTPMSILAYNEELNRLYLIITGDNLNDELYLSTVSNLENLANILVLKADLTSLGELYNKVKNYKQSDYSASSYAYYSYALNASLNLMINANATQEEVDNVELMLNDAIDKLRKPIKIVYLKIGETIDIDDFIVTGVSSIIGYHSHNNELVYVDNEGNIKGFRYGDTKITIYFDNGISETLDVKIQAEITTSTFVLVFVLPIAILITGYFVTFVKRKDIANWFRNRNKNRR